MLSGFLRLGNEVVDLLGCYTALIDSYRRFGTTSESSLQRPGSFLGQLDILIFTKTTVGNSDLSVLSRYVRCTPRYLSRYSDSIRAGRSGIESR
jgi:hypothetical protein